MDIKSTKTLKEEKGFSQVMTIGASDGGSARPRGGDKIGEIRKPLKPPPNNLSSQSSTIGSGQEWESRTKHNKRKPYFQMETGFGGFSAEHDRYRWFFYVVYGKGQRQKTPQKG
ncbi:NSP (nuclear shuttle protein)-interacting GTPase [Striga asiatica]|uniref:NSP (Nuclear shuttle protein)-interacting GTPase n=1 Tax=Striga asiatica TaxID=4170 RepID=A0A5A7R5G7_STRAF|nr:NSP (nuclear shuttle protein)-interacting GTPase [Striga asiatica]